MPSQKPIIANNPTHLEMLVRNAVKSHGLECSLNHIDVSGITDFQGVFRKYPNFNGDLSGWELSEESRKSMFETIALSPVVASDREQLKIFVRQAIKANGLSCSLNHIDTSSIGTSIDLFREHPGFNGDISQWAVAECTATDVVFKKVPQRPVVARDLVHLLELIKTNIKVNDFNCNLSHIDVQNVQGWIDIWKECPGFSGDVSAWGSAKMVKGCLVFKEFPQDPIVARDRDHLVQLMKHVVGLNGPACNLNHIDVSSIQDFHALFKDLPEFNGDISQWDVSHVKNFDNLFQSSQFTGDISKWDTSNVQSMRLMFNDSSFNGDISSWNTSAVRTMQGMFTASQFNQPIGDWDVRQVKDFEATFMVSKFTQSLSKWDTSGALRMDAMFAGSQFNGDISGWNVSNVRGIRKMFWKAIFSGDVSRWNLHPKIQDEYMLNVHLDNPHFLERQSISPLTIRFHLLNKTAPSDPLWRKAMALSAPIAQGLGLSTLEHAHAIVATHSGLVDSMGAGPQINEQLFEPSL